MLLSVNGDDVYGVQYMAKSTHASHSSVSQPVHRLLIKHLAQTVIVSWPIFCDLSLPSPSHIHLECKLQICMQGGTCEPPIKVRELTSNLKFKTSFMHCSLTCLIGLLELSMGAFALVLVRELWLGLSLCRAVVHGNEC